MHHFCLPYFKLRFELQNLIETFGLPLPHSSLVFPSLGINLQGKKKRKRKKKAPTHAYIDPDHDKKKYIYQINFFSLFNLIPFFIIIAPQLPFNLGCVLM
jgi:hypothetical protein